MSTSRQVLARQAPRERRQFRRFATAGECAGCHDDSIANEHFALDPYKTNGRPCSVCHAANYTVGAYSPDKATVAAQVAAGNISCNGCHTTSTQSSPHAKRMGTTTTLGSTQFDNSWSGHRLFSTMGGSLTIFPNIVGATRNWSLPSVAGNWLKAPYNVAGGSSRR